MDDRDITRGMILIGCALLLALLLDGCGPRVALWQDREGGGYPYTGTVRCRPSPVSHEVDIRSATPQIVRVPEVER